MPPWATVKQACPRALELCPRPKGVNWMLLQGVRLKKKGQVRGVPLTEHS